MEKYTEKIVDVATGKETVRQYTAEEIAAIEAELAKNAAEKIEQETKETARQTVLAKLGLTVEEAAALLA
jgi:hypothetical protein